MFKVSYQPIPLLQDTSGFPEVWAWCVSEGSVIIARFGSRDLAEGYSDYRIAETRGLAISLDAHQRLAEALNRALTEKVAAEQALQAFVEGKLVVKP